MAKEYSTINEAVYSLNNILDVFVDRFCTFENGCEIVSDITAYTPFDTSDWGVYYEEGIITLYNNDAEVVMQVLGDNNNRIYNWKFSISAIQNMTGLKEEN